MFKIEYNVPFPEHPTSAGKQRYRKQYVQIFDFVHSDKKEMILDVDETILFIRYRHKAMINRYQDLLYYMTYDKGKVMVIKRAKRKS